MYIKIFKKSFCKDSVIRMKWYDQIIRVKTNAIKTAKVSINLRCPEYSKEIDLKRLFFKALCHKEKKETS